MNESQAVDAFASLAQETRLRIVRELVRAGPNGLAAGVIADAVGVSPSNLSFHLSHLERAGIVQARRAARSVIYSATYGTLGELVRFLMEECCAGDPRIRSACFPGDAGCHA
jgi:ArsR family transcriptional regulator